MSATIIDGRALAERLRRSIDEELQVLRLSEVAPGLATVLVGDDPAAAAYERHLRRLAEGLGYHYVCERLPAAVEPADALATVGKLNADPRVTGILLLRPLPAHLRHADLDATVDPRKDIEAAHPTNVGLLALGTPRFLPSTPASCFYALDAYLRDSGREPSAFYARALVCVVGRSSTVGKPAQWLALQRDATVIACHSRTDAAGRLGELTRLADVVLVAAGVPKLLRPEMVRPGAIVLDVGFHQLPDGSIVGDVDPRVAEVAEALTPVPGGIGPITDVWLVGNALAAAAIARQVEPRFGSGTARG
ncbi:MAG: bifunctional protein FolD [Actinomycetota bacterium]|jgi:methylenetetrahydrofolate dehydrogenase (NADP+)/methenyltetrahydrofolate cyclohydrolase|nr:MAG: bifunctional protein FolD [Actinomycetota bacterium]